MGSFLMTVVTLSGIALMFSLVIAVIRLIKGPTLADRVVALDLISFITVAFIALYTLYSGQKALLDIAITLGLIAFLGTIAFARYIAKIKGEVEE